MPGSAALRAAIFLPFTLAVALPAGRSATTPAPDPLGGEGSGRRPALAQQGVSIGLTYTLAALAALDGGLRRGTLLEGTADLFADFDFSRLAALPATQGRLGLVSAHGPSISANYVGDVRAISDFDMPDGLYFREAWLEHTWGEDLVAVRVGKISADDDTVVYGTADSILLPIFPDSALGARARVAVSERWTFEAAVFDGDPFSPGRNRDRRGLNFRLSRHEGATVVGAVHLKTGLGPDPLLPPGTWKFGLYRTSRDVDSVATGTAVRGSRAFFVDVTQTVWRERTVANDGAQGLDFYATAEITQSDRNTFRSSTTAGLTRTGLIPGRDADVLDVSLYYTRFSSAFSRASLASGGPAYTFENALRVFYRLEFSPAFALQPQVDHVLRPGGSGEIPAATVASLRATLTF